MVAELMYIELGYSLSTVSEIIIQNAELHIDYIVILFTA